MLIKNYIECPCCGSGNISKHVRVGYAVLIRNQDWHRCSTCMTEWDEHKRQPPNAWIACSERLPEAFKEVVVICDGFPKLGWVAENGQWFVQSQKALTVDTKFTYWQPLPQPPETGKDGNDVRSL